MLKFEFPKQFHIEHNKVNIFLYVTKALKYPVDLLVKTLVHLHEILSSN